MTSVPKRGLWAVCFIVAVLGAATPLLLSGRAGFSAFFRAPDSALTAVYGTSRFFYPRLSVRQTYQPCRPEAEPGLVPGYDCTVTSRDRGLLQRRLQAAERSFRGADEWAAGEQGRDSRWLLRLATAQKGQFAAIAQRLEAEARSASEADRWIDASAALYVAATTEDRPGLLSPALAASERAQELDPRSPAAAFNRALILEALALRSEARKAWQEFLTLEKKGAPWRAEARQHLQALSTPSVAEQWEATKREIQGGRPVTEADARELVAGFARPIRDWIEFELLPTWAQAWLKDRTTPSKPLDVAATMAHALGTEIHEELPSAQIRDLHKALQSRNTAVPISLARAIIGLRDARTRYIHGDYQSTLDTLARVERDLGASRPALLFWVRYYQAASLDQQGLKQDAETLLTSLVADLEGESFPSLRARAQALRGRIKNNLGRPEEAIPLLVSTIDALDALNDAETGTWARTLLGDSYRLLGDLESCWQQYYVALHQIENLGTPLRELAAANAMADFLISAGDDRLALYYQNAAVSLGPRLENPSFFAEVLLWRSLLLSRVGDEPGALADLERAQREATKIRDPLRLDRFRADLGLYQGAELLDRDPTAAADALGNALRYFERTEHWSRVLLSLEARALAYGRLGDRELQLRDLERARELYVRVGRQLKQDSVRVSFAGRIESAFDQTLRLRLGESSDAETSFSQLEQERALNHPVRYGNSWLTQPVSISEVHSALAPGMALVEYAVLTDRLLVWLILNGKISLYISEITKPELTAALAHFLIADWSGPRWRQASASLGKIVLGKVQPELARAGVTSLIIVPDDELFGVPFAALTLPSTGRLLVKDYALAVSPSASLFTRAVRRQNETRRRKEPLRAVAVANPAIDESIWKHLPPLSAASSEGISVQRLFPGSAELLAGDKATMPALQSRLFHASWLHFAGHSIALPRRPLDSYLLLSPSPEHSGKLTAEQLLTWDLIHLQGVVLSACSSAASAKESWPGAVTLARPFLAASVPLVIGSLWEVQDQDSADFFDNFYRQFALHGSAFRSFHEAQLAALAKSGEDRLSKNGWIALQLFGAPDVPALREGE